MNEQLRNLILIGGIVGAGYLAFNYYTDEALPLKFTRKIAQQIKHQILIVTINFAAGSREGLNKLRLSGEGKAEQLVQYFTTKMAEIYDNKENLILGKYNIPKEKFRTSLEKYKKDPKLKSIQNQIIQMMEKSVKGEIPDLTIDKRATSSFTKDQIKKTYEDMSKMILVSLIAKLQAQKKNNPHFDTNNDEQFKKAIRQLNIYDKKIDFFKSRGFKEEWGCPNETFFKLSESLKIKDINFKQQMAKLERTYQQIVDIAAKDPFSISIQKINDYYTNQAMLKRDLIKQEEPAEDVDIGVEVDVEQEKQQSNQEQINLARSVAEAKRPRLGVDQLINMNRSTRSEPEHDDIVPIPEVNSSAPQSEEPIEQPVPRSKSVKQPAQQERLPQRINIEHVPSDAKQLQKQIEAQHKQNEENTGTIMKKQQQVHETQQQHHQHHEQPQQNKQQEHAQKHYHQHAQQNHALSVQVSQAQSNVAVHDEPIKHDGEKREEYKQQEHQSNEHHQA